MAWPEKGRNAALILDDELFVALVESSGTMPGDVRVQLEGPWKSIHSLLELKNFLKANRADGFGSGGLFTPTHPIIVRPNNETRWGHAMAAYNTLVEARYTNITLGKP